MSMGGGGSSVSIPQRNISTEFPQIKQGYGLQEGQYSQFINKDPLLKGSYGAASSLFGPMASQILPIIQSGGALTPELQRDADQSALGLSAGAGMANSNAGIAGALLNRDQFRQQRLSTAIGQYGQLQGETLQPFQQGVEGFSKLTNPILAYLSDLNSSNQNAAAAQSIAGANQSAGKSSGILSTVGSVVGAAATAY